MGAAMARKLVGAGHEVTVWNRTEAAARELAAEIGARADTAAWSAVANADVVISMLATGEATEAVLLDERVRAALRRGTVVVDMATSGVSTARTLDAELSAQGVLFVDAPVSGSVPTIEAGQLLVMASGSDEGVTRVAPVLEAFAKRVAYLGGAGSGQAMKLAVNLVVHTLNSGVAEALALTSSAGVDPSDAYDIFLDSVVAAPFLNYKRSAFLDPQTPVAMSLALTAKDLRLITEFMSAQGVPGPVGGAVRDEVEAACEAGFAEEDMAGLARFLRSSIEGPER
jgi:3-hydroxyisobutyrate dehydrogenase-like beta-hydroxyacid dehydrogenase